MRNGQFLVGIPDHEHALLFFVCYCHWRWQTSAEDSLKNFGRLPANRAKQENRIYVTNDWNVTTYVSRMRTFSRELLHCVWSGFIYCYCSFPCVMISVAILYILFAHYCSCVTYFD